MQENVEGEMCNLEFFFRFPLLSSKPVGSEERYEQSFIQTAGCPALPRSLPRARDLYSALSLFLSALPPRSYSLRAALDWARRTENARPQ